MIANGVADGDRSGCKDVRAWAASVDELLDQARPGHLLQVEAWLAEGDAPAFHVGDQESSADEVVQPGAVDGQLATSLSGRLVEPRRGSSAAQRGSPLGG